MPDATAPETLSASPAAEAARLLDVVVVSAGSGRELVRACLESLRRHPPALGPIAVHVVDNASPDGTAEMVRTEFPEVQLDALDWNSGFCHANNLALARTSAPYALLLNPDTEVYAGALDHMLRLMDARPDVGMASCRLEQPDGTFDHAAKRSFPTPLGALAHFTRVGRRAGAGSRLGQYRAVALGEHDAGEVDAVNGAFMLVRRSAMEQVGLLDEAYWLYMEDLDWCYRFGQRGWKVFYDGSVSCLHVKGGATYGAGTGGVKHRRLRQNFAFHRGMGRFYRKFYAGERPALDLLVYLGIGGKFAVSASRSAIARRSVTS